MTEASLNESLFLRMLMRLDQRAFVLLLEAPCLWCNYNGASYWQSGSHELVCPWRDVASSQSRLEILAHGPSLASYRTGETHKRWLDLVRKSTPIIHQRPQEEGT